MLSFVHLWITVHLSNLLSHYLLQQTGIFSTDSNSFFRWTYYHLWNPHLENGVFSKQKYLTTFFILFAFIASFNLFPFYYSSAVGYWSLYSILVFMFIDFIEGEKKRKYKDSCNLIQASVCEKFLIAQIFHSRFTGTHWFCFFFHCYGYQ